VLFYLPISRLGSPSKYSLFFGTDFLVNEVSAVHNLHHSLHLSSVLWRPGVTESMAIWS